MYEMKPEYYIGIDMIDEEHKQLFKYADEAYELLHDEFTPDKYDRIDIILENLRNYTVKHFSDEEQYMESINYKKIFTQKVQHQEFIHKLDEFVEHHNDEVEDQDEQIMGILILSISLYTFCSKKLSRQRLCRESRFTMSAGVVGWKPGSSAVGGGCRSCRNTTSAEARCQANCGINAVRCASRYRSLRRIICTTFHHWRQTTISRANPPIVPIPHKIAPNHRFQFVNCVACQFSFSAVKQLLLNSCPKAFAPGVVMTPAARAVHALHKPGTRDRSTIFRTRVLASAVGMKNCSEQRRMAKNRAFNRFYAQFGTHIICHRKPQHAGVIAVENCRNIELSITRFQFRHVCDAFLARCF